MSARDHMLQRQREAADIAQDDPEGMLDVSDLYDSERMEIDRVYATLGQHIQSRMELGAFQREVRERFAEIGIEARCDLYESMHEDHLPQSERTQYPSITLIRKIEKRDEFDHEQMRHEVRANILGVKGQEPKISTQVAPGWAKSGSGLIVPGK